MKKAKIMLMSIAILATVGTALAFKVAKKVQSTYCYLQTTSDPGPGKVCPNTIETVTAEGDTDIQYYYTTLTAIDCSQQEHCELKANRFGE
jgi:hypothetical protein